MKSEFLAASVRATVAVALCALWSSAALAQNQAPGEAGDGIGSAVPGETASDGSAVSEPHEPGESQPVRDPDADLPWNRDTTEEQRARAEELFQDGNRLIADNLPLLAIDRYTEAVELWPNPVIYYNLAMVEMRANRMMPAVGHFEKALSHGSSALADDPETGRSRLDEASKRLAELRSQLTEIEVVCDAPGAKVFFGEQYLFTGPGHFQGQVRIGAYSLIAAMEGFESDVRQGVLAPQEKTRFELSPKKRVMVRRYSPWLPRGVFGLTLVATVVGGVAYGQARARFKDYDEEVDGEFHNRGDGGSVGLLPEIEALLHKGERRQTIASVAFLTAGVSLIAATALYFANMPREEFHAATPTLSSLSIAPTLSPHSAGISARLKF